MIRERDPVYSARDSRIGLYSGWSGAVVAPGAARETGGGVTGRVEGASGWGAAIASSASVAISVCPSERSVGAADLRAQGARGR